MAEAEPSAQTGAPSDICPPHEPTGEVGEVRRWLLDHGATEEQLQEAPTDPYELQRLAVHLVLNRGASLSVRDLAARDGSEPGQVADALRAFGIVVDDVDAALFTEHDAELLTVLRQAELFDPVDIGILARAIATALDRVAEAAVAMYVQSAEAELVRTGASPLAFAERSTQVTELSGQLGAAMGVLFRHHLRQAIERQRVSQVGVASPDVARLAVGFVDLVGSTALGESLDVGELRKLVNVFETEAFEVASRLGGRVVKFIGDEIMVAAVDPVAGCRLMLALVDALLTTGMQPRGGMAWGEVLFRGGDYYGREVNLASRLVDAAIPGEVLVDGAMAEAMADGPPQGLGLEPAGRRVLKGFADPVPVWSLTSSGGLISLGGSTHPV